MWWESNLDPLRVSIEATTTKMSRAKSPTIAMASRAGLEAILIMAEVIFDDSHFGRKAH